MLGTAGLGPTPPWIGTPLGEPPELELLLLPFPAPDEPLMLEPEPPLEPPLDPVLEPLPDEPLADALPELPLDDPPLELPDGVLPELLPLSRLGGVELAPWQPPTLATVIAHESDVTPASTRRISMTRIISPFFFIHSRA